MSSAIIKILGGVAVAGLLATAVMRGWGRHRSRRRLVESVPGLDVTRAQFWATVLAAGALSFLVVYALTGLVAVSLVPAPARSAPGTPAYVLSMRLSATGYFNQPARIVSLR